MAAVATALALTCGGEDNGPSGNAGSIQIALTPATFSLPQGGTGAVTLALTRGGGFDGAVTLTSAGLPSGVTTTITPAQLSGTTTSATVEVSVAATVATGNYNGTVTATAPGVSAATTTYQVVVNVAANYALTVSPAALTLAAGTTGSATVSIARTNFTGGGVALAVVNAPAGITGAFNPTPSTTNSSTLALNVAANVAVGSYALTIQGTANGPGVKTTTLALTVPAPPSGSHNVEYQFCDASQTPLFFAYQDGSGAWQPVTGFPSGSMIKFAFNLTQGRGGVLSVFRAPSTAANVLTAGRMTTVRRQMATGRVRSGAALGNLVALQRSVADAYRTEVVYASTAELTQDGIDNCAQTQPTKTVTGTVVAVGANSIALLSLGSFSQAFGTGMPEPPPLTLSFTAPPGTTDFVGTRMAFTNNQGSPPTAAVLLRNLNIPDGGSLPATIDFRGPLAMMPATANATVSGGGGDDLEISTTLVTTNGEMLFWRALTPNSTAIRPWAGLSNAAMMPGDFHGVLVSATLPNEFPDITDFREALKYVGPVSSQTLALGPGLSAPSMSQIAAGAYPRYRFQGTLPAEYNKSASIDVGSPGAGNVYSIIASSAYLTAAGSALAYDFTMPDVGGLATFPVAARLTTGPNELRLGASGFTGPGIFDLRPTLGSEFKTASKLATINVP
jgi:hypothetical protein